MKIKKLLIFFKSTIGTNHLFALFSISIVFVILKMVSLLLPFFTERFVNAIQEGIFVSQYLYVIAIIYSFSFLLQNIISFIYGKCQIAIKNKLQLFLVDSILLQNPLYIKTKGEGFFAKLLDQSVDTIMNTVTPYNLYTFFLIPQNIAILTIF